MKLRFAMIGLIAGGSVAFLIRPEAPLVGQLPFKTVIRRGADLEGLSQLLRPIAERSFNDLVAGCIVGAFIGLVSGHLISQSRGNSGMST